MSSYRITEITKCDGTTFRENSWCRSGEPEGPTARITGFVVTDHGVEIIHHTMEPNPCGQEGHLIENRLYRISQPENVFPEHRQPSQERCPECGETGYFARREV